MAQLLRVLGVDTSLRSSGVAVVEREGTALRAVIHRTIKNQQKLSHSTCLRNIHEGIMAAIDETEPSLAAIEGIFHFKNSKTAVTLGQARGVVIVACALRNIPVFEYAPRRVKQAVCGTGAASKDQVGRMVTTMLHLAEAPQEDAADALAIAICHLNSQTSIASLAPKEI